MGSLNTIEHPPGLRKNFFLAELHTMLHRDSRRILGGMLLLLVPLLAASSLADKVRAVMPTAAEERWLHIPWRTSLMEARAVAQREGKPMFLWIMNGSPLGCT
jgi:hypothetical protein